MLAKTAFVFTFFKHVFAFLKRMPLSGTAYRCLVVHIYADEVEILEKKQAKHPCERTIATAGLNFKNIRLV